jgi:transcriptional antiterminator RfaH
MTTAASQIARWYCVQTKPKNERRVADFLETAGLAEAFCPRVRFRRMTRRGAVWFTEALFPNYFFARMKLADSLGSLRTTPGARGLVRFGEQYAAVDDRVIADLRRCMEEGSVRVFEDPLKPGDAVQVLTGPFRGLEATVTRILPAKERVRVLMDFLGRQTEAEISLGEVARDGRRPVLRVEPPAAPGSRAE